MCVWVRPRLRTRTGTRSFSHLGVGEVGELQPLRVVATPPRRELFPLVIEGGAPGAEAFDGALATLVERACHVGHRDAAVAQAARW